MKNITFPAWFNGPNGETQIFDRIGDVPKGWTSGAEKQTVNGALAPAPTTSSEDGAPVDADGWPWSADLHASTKTLTKEGLWRMKVGVSRPDPKSGFPKVHDL